MGNNSLVTTGSMPAHLQALMQDARLQTLNQDAVKGLSAGSWPRISLKGGRFRLQDPQGQEFVVPVNQLDVVLIATNPHGVSKIYYEGAYDPSGDGTAPTCYSDNGVAPSTRASKPQCGTCAACPHNAWGSKVTPGGAQVKACADIKKLAVLLADNTGGPIFEMRVPAASLSNLGAYIRGLDAAGIPAATVVTRLQFDTDSDYPKLLFSMPTVVEGQQPWAYYPYISAEMQNDVLEVIGSDEVKQCTGENDKPFVQKAPQGSIGDQAAFGPARAPLAAAALPTRAPLAPPPPPAHVSGTPLPAGAVGPTPPPNPAFPHAGQPAQAAPAAAAPAPAKRTRRAKAPEAGLAPLAPAAAPAPAAPAATPPAGFFNRMRDNAAPAPATAGVATVAQTATNGRDASAPVAVAVTNAQLDDLIENAMKV